MGSLTGFETFVIVALVVIVIALFLISNQLSGR